MATRKLNRPFRYWVGSDDEITFDSNTTLPNHFVYNRFQDVNAYAISPSGHPNTLALSPSVLNLTGHDARSAATPQTFVGRRQEHIEFIFEVTLEFNSTQDQAEAGVSVFLNQAQHFDLGVVKLSPDSATEAGLPPVTTGNDNDTTINSYIRLRTITANSTNSGATDPFSSPAILPLNSSTGTKLKLQVEAVNHTTYAFRYTDDGNGSEWKTVGLGNSSQVSGGFTGTSPSCTRVVPWVNLNSMSLPQARSWVCLPQEMETMSRILRISLSSRTRGIMMYFNLLLHTMMSFRRAPAIQKVLQYSGTPC